MSASISSTRCRDLGLRHLRHLQAEGDVLRDGDIGKERIGLEHHADVALVRA